MLKCYLDLDGVLVDFTGPAHAAHGIKFSHDSWPYEFGSYSWPPPAGLDKQEWWDKFDGDFYEYLPWTRDGKEILEIVEKKFGKENICLLTSITLEPTVASGKIKWITREMPDYAKMFSITPARAKAFSASKDIVLVDDSHKNTDEFRAAGGYAVCVPRPWNRYYSKDTLSTLQEVLDTVIVQVALRETL